MSLLRMSISGGVLILFAVVIRFLALHRLPKTTFLILWEIVALRLLLPVSIQLPFRIYTQVEYLASALESGAVGQAISESIPGVAVQPHAETPISIASVIWLAGMGLLAAYFTISYVRNGRKFRMSIPCENPLAEKWLDEHRITRPMEVRVSDQIFSPLTYGILRPIILLPKKTDYEDKAALSYILTHEYVHIRRFDTVIKLVFAAALCVHWFNPLVWIMYVLANRDMELSCDGGVVRILGEQEKSAYALTLISMEEKKSGCFSLYSHFSKNAVEERIELIMKYKRSSVLAIVLSLVLVVGATTAFAASGGKVDDNDAVFGSIEELEGIEIDYIIGSLEDIVGTEVPSGPVIVVEDWELEEEEDADAELAPGNEVVIGTMKKKLQEC